MESPPASVLELIERFEDNKPSYKSLEYNETQLRREYLDPFFDALGWDVANTQGYAEAYKDVSVDDAFLETIEQWRAHLARNLALRNPGLSTADLNFAVQRTIDRIVFLRICEDRGIENYGRLRGVSEGANVYPRLCANFRRADDKYNSGLFHFSEARERSETSDRITPSLRLDDDILRGILSSLYYPESPYEFSVLPSDILGQIYERFLGKVIRLTPSHQAKIEEKPEVRKAGGVYYTPQHVVDYIVRGTVGHLLQSKTPKQASVLKVLDPACGSGSFLLGAYQHLLDWHRGWYISNGAETHARGRKPALFRDRHGEWQLTTAMRKELLQNNIFGVDLDAQAVEVTKLSLLLKVLEGETEETLNKNLRLFEERALPDLGKNIQCGNSLIDADYFATAPSGGDEDNTNAFDWKRRFPEVFAQGGFDAVIGNPPYLSYGGRQVVEIPEAHTKYFERCYESVGWATAHSFFMERSAKLLAKRFVSFIVPDQVGHLEGYRSLRGVLLRHGGLVEVKYWGERVFAGVVTPALTFLLDKETTPETTRIFSADASVHTGKIENDGAWTVAGSKKLLEKLAARTMSLRPHIADCGVRTTDSRRQVLPVDEARGRFIPTLEGKQVGRYRCAAPQVGVRLDAGDVFHSKEEKYRRARFLIRQTAAYPIVGPHDHAIYFRNSLHALYEPEQGVDVRYLVGLLNSKVIRFAYVKMIREASQRTFPQVKLTPLGYLPIRSIDFALPSDRAAHDRVVALVEALLIAHRKLLAEKNPARVEEMRHRADGLDASIDTEVYKLYELNEEEVAEIDKVVATLAPPP